MNTNVILTGDNLEFERKFLLFKKPNFKADVVYKIEQHYYGDERIRRKSTEGQEDLFYHTIKKNIKPGVNSEIEKKINREEYNKLLEKSKSYLVKSRHCYLIGDKTFEVDIFDDISLIIMEVEFKSEQELNDFVIPSLFKNLVLLEVTHLREFGNRKISKKINGYV